MSTKQLWGRVKVKKNPKGLKLKPTLDNLLKMQQPSFEAAKVFREAQRQDKPIPDEMPNGAPVMNAIILNMRQRAAMIPLTAGKYTDLFQLKNYFEKEVALAQVVLENKDTYNPSNLTDAQALLRAVTDAVAQIPRTTDLEPSSEAIKEARKQLGVFTQTNAARIPEIYPGRSADVLNQDARSLKAKRYDTALPMGNGSGYRANQGRVAIPLSREIMEERQIAWHNNPEMLKQVPKATTAKVEKSAALTDRMQGMQVPGHGTVLSVRMQPIAEKALAKVRKLGNEITGLKASRSKALQGNAAMQIAAEKEHLAGELAKRQDSLEKLDAGKLVVAEESRESYRKDLLKSATGLKKMLAKKDRELAKLYDAQKELGHVDSIVRKKEMEMAALTEKANKVDHIIEFRDTDGSRQMKRMPFATLNALFQAKGIEDRRAFEQAKGSQPIKATVPDPRNPKKHISIVGTRAEVAWQVNAMNEAKEKALKKEKSELAALIASDAAKERKAFVGTTTLRKAMALVAKNRAGILMARSSASVYEGPRHGKYKVTAKGKKDYNVKTGGIKVKKVERAWVKKDNKWKYLPRQRLNLPKEIVKAMNKADKEKR